MPKPPITYSDIARALRRGLITKEGLLNVANGWQPGKRGPKQHLLHQAHILGVYELLIADNVPPTIARDAIMNAQGGPKQSRFYELLKSAQKNWTPCRLPPFDSYKKIGEKRRAIMLTRTAPAENGLRHTITIEINLLDWLR